MSKGPERKYVISRVGQIVANTCWGGDTTLSPRLRGTGERKFSSFPLEKPFSTAKTHTRRAESRLGRGNKYKTTTRMGLDLSKKEDPSTVSKGE